MIVYWFYKDFMDKGVTVNHVQMNVKCDEEENEEIQFEGDDGKDQTFKGVLGVDKPNGEYNFKGNITDLKEREQYK